MPASSSSPFDRRRWLPPMPRPEDARSWLDAWVDLTTWWVDPAIAAGQSMAALRPDQALAQLVDGVARQFAGRRLDVRVRGRRVQGTLEGIGMVRKTDRSELSIDLQELDVDGTAIERLDVRARSVQLDAGPTPTFTAEDIDVDGNVPLRTIVAFADDRVDGWSLAVDDRDRILATHDERRVTIRIEPSVRDGEVRLELRAVRWRGRGVRVPRWLRLDRSFPIAIEPGWTVAEATQHGDRVRFRIHGDRVTEPLDLARLRDAIVATGPLVV